MLLTGAQIVMECLLEQGVDVVFGYPGGAVLNLYDAVYEYQDRITHILTAHEQAAAHAADGYARSTGKTGVCIATSGPGATNLVTGIATAFMDSVPMIAITGNVSRNLLGLDSFQEVDITGITMPITKHNYIIKEIDELADVIREAFYVANDGRKGPVLIDIPKDITAMKAEYIPVQPIKSAARLHLSENRIQRALNLMRTSRRPLLYAGGGIIASGAQEALARFAEKLDAPVACSLMGLGGYDQRGSRYMGMLGMHGTKTSSLAIAECDLFIAVGTRFSDRVTCNTSLFAQNRPIIHIDLDPAEFDKSISVALKIAGDAGEILNALCDKMPQADHSSWMQDINQWKQEYPLEQAAEDPEAVTPKYFLETLSELAGENTIICTEVGQHQMWTAQFYQFTRPRQLVTSGGLGTMGFGLGAAIGAQVANPKSRVINIAGDGSFHMNANELSTVAKYNLPIIEIVFNNQVLGMVRQWQRLFYDGRFSQTTLEKKTDYELLAKAYGVGGCTIRTKSEVRPVLEAALADGGPMLINCIIDRDMNVLPMVPAGASVENPILYM